MGSLLATAEALRFGKYSLVARLATGGMAEIFLARLQGAAGFEKLVCIKRILPHLARDRQFVAMFLDEARIAARISHPNVCQVFELGEIDGSYYIAMEYLEGVPLACFRRRDYYGAMPDPRLVAAIAIQACEGLHHAHQLRAADGSVMEVVHRDVSPQNLFVTVDGVVKVLDFGIAKIQDATVRTSTGAVKGTYAYMAPEQLRGERVDRRTDVFAMGIVMWEILTRRHLFRRDTEFLTFQAITSEPIEDICALRPDVPPALGEVITTALSRDREGRYATARKLADAIAAAVTPLSASAVSEEIARAFPAELAEQAAVVRVAREGGAFDLNLERGPAVGHGTELLTTPTSSQYGTRAPSPGSDVAGGAGIGATQIDRPRSGGPGSGVTGRDGPGSGGPGSVPASSITGSGITGSGVLIAPPPAPSAATSRALRPIAIAAVALGLGGGGAYAYARLTRGGEPAARGPAVGGPAAVVSLDPAPIDAGASAAPRAAEPVGAADPVPHAAAPVATPRASTGVSAGPAPSEGAPRRAPASTEPREPEPREPAPREPAPREPSPRRTAAAAPRPTGPSGYVTIDSAPVYAVIYIDGKSYGETPLVKVALPPGRHTVHAVAPSGATQDVRITIEAGKVAPARRIEW